MFRRHCKRIVESVIDQAENYIQCGYQIIGFVMMDGSPVCGLNHTPQPKDPNVLWGGMTYYIPKSEFIEGKGIYCEILQEGLKQRGFDKLPFVASSEFDEIGKLDFALDTIKELILDHKNE
jgi:predicted secreted protein